MNIRKYFLIQPTDIEHCNPGDILIARGIEYLLEEAEKRLENIPIFRYISLFTMDNKVWENVLEEADYIVLCGTPQLGTNGDRHFDNLYPMLKKAKEKGIIIANLFVGAGNGNQRYDKEQLIEEIYEKHKDTWLPYFNDFDLVITRDEIIQEVMKKNKTESHLLLDSVFYARDFYKQENNPKAINLIVINRAGDLTEKVANRVKEIKLDQSKPTFYLCHNRKDYEAYKSLLDNDSLICIDNPKELIKLYSYANEVISVRVHGSIPSISFGASVAHIGTDCRSEILKRIGGSVELFDDFTNEGKYTFFQQDMTQAKEQNLNTFVNLWYLKCQKKYGNKKLDWATNYCNDDYWKGTGKSGYGEIVTYMDARVEKILTKLVELYPRKTLLELGCASGASINFLNNKGYRAMGIDISAYAIDKGKEVWKDIDTVQGSVHDLSKYSDSSLDIVYSQQVLEHLPTELVSDLIKEIKRVLKPKGIVLLYLVIGYSGSIARAGSDGDCTHWNLKTKDWWISQFNKEGFEEDTRLDRIMESVVPYNNLHRLALKKIE